MHGFVFVSTFVSSDSSSCRILMIKLGFAFKFDKIVFIFGLVFVFRLYSILELRF